MSRDAILRIKEWLTQPVYKNGVCVQNGGAVLFVRDVFGVEPDEWQIDFLNYYQSSERTAAKACKGPGKTAVLAWCMWHFLVCHENSKIPATSITGDNLRDGLWTELAKWQQRSEFLKQGFTWHAERVVANQAPDQWYMSARKWSQSADKEQQANALAGLHADDIMFVIDEVGGVPDAVMAAAEAALSNAGTDVNPYATAKLLICGNPTHLSGPLYRACSSEASLWKVIEITGDPDNPKRSPRISIPWAKQQIAKYGRDNAWVLVNVFGQFPPSSVNGLLGPDEVQAAMNRVLPPDLYIREAKVLGVDCGGGGHDPSVIMPRQGLAYFQPKIMRLSDPKLIAGAVAVASNKWKPDMIFVDNTGGWGSGVISYLNDWGHPVTAVGFAEKSSDPIYYNKRTEILSNFARDVKDGCALPNIPAFKEACVAQQYTHNKDKLQMIDKSELKEGVSDTVGFDILDAAALTRAYPVSKRNVHEAYNKKQEMDYNPMHGTHVHQVGDEYGYSNQDYNPLDTGM